MEAEIIELLSELVFAIQFLGSFILAAMIIIAVAMYFIAKKIWLNK